MTEHFRLSGMYWGLTAIDLLGQLNDIDKEETIAFIKKCQIKENGGFAPSIGHDAHILYTLSAIQVANFALNNFDLCFIHFFYRFWLCLTPYMKSMWNMLSNI